MPTLTDAEVLGIRIHRRTQRDALETMCALLADGQPHSVYFVHAATANVAFEDPAFRAVLNRGHLVLNDGVGVRWAARAQGVLLEQNLVGTDLVPELLRQSFERPLRVFLLGGRPGVIERAAARLRERFPQIALAGFQHGYFPASDEAVLVDHIRRSAADIVLVGMGNPRQEYFIDRRLPDLGCRLAIGVGGLFDHFAGELRRAPGWMQRLGLEWSQLLMQQPHKWRRYLVGGPQFLWRVFGHTARASVRGAAIAVLSLAVGLMAAEGIVRHVRPQILERYPAGLYIASQTRQYKLRPHFRGVFRYPEFQTEVRINGQGLRAARDYSPAHPGILRILAVGDSFTMGYSVDEPLTWVRVLEGELNARGHSGSAEVINAGVPGYSTWQELTYLEEEGFALGPDVVILAFFMGNDIADNAAPQLPVEMRDGRLIAAGSQAGVMPLELRLWTARHSHLYNLAWPVQRTLRRRPAAATKERWPDAGWKATAGLVDRVARSCAARHARLLVLLIPERYQVESGKRREVAEPNQRMGSLCRQAGVAFLDLLDSFSGPGLYYPQDGHWTPQGNKAAAYAIFDRLSQQF